MKKIWLFILGLFTISFIWNFTQAKDYEYTNLDITANILNDGTINVNENFTANFFVNKHWIIRDIPLNYSVEWKDFHIEVSNINVDWKNFTTNKNNWNIEIKIWDANRTVIWEQNYPISYSTYGLIRNFSWMWYAELYWNLVGYDFDTNINKVRAELILPKTYTWFTKDDFLITTDWTAKTIDWFTWTVDWGRWDRIIITYDKWLSAYHGITLAIKFPDDYFNFNQSAQAKLVWHLSWNHFFEKIFHFFLKLPLWIYLIMFLVIIVIIGEVFHINWSKILDYQIKIFDDKNSKIENKLKIDSSVVVEYMPPEWVSCAEAWMLFNCLLEPTDLTSLLYKWIIEWLISIELCKDSYCSVSGNSSTVRNFIITKLKNIDKNRPPYELDFFKALLPGNINSKKVVSPASKFDIVRSLKSLRNYGKKQWWIVVWYFDDSIKYIPRLLVFWLSFCFFYFGSVCGPLLSLFISLLVTLPMIFLCKNSNYKVYIVWFVAFSLLSCVFFFYGFDLFLSLVISFFLSSVLILPMIWSLANSDKSKKTIQKMIYLTDLWKELSLKVIWYAKFLRECDENKFRLFLQQDPTFFDKALPFAVAFWFSTDFINKATPVLKELDVRPVRFDFDIDKIYHINDTFIEIETRREKEKSDRFEKFRKIIDYDSDGWFSGWSSFWWWFSSGWGWGWGWGRSW